MGKLIDRAGQKINHWTFISYFGLNKHGESMWNCICDCGLEQVCVTGNITSGGSKQCSICSRKPRDYSEEISNSMWNLILIRANKKDHEVTISKEEAYILFLKQDKKCKLSGVDIRFSRNSSDYLNRGQTASLDRIDSTKGYIKGNVQWVHKYINLMKGSMKDEEFIRYCTNVSNHNSNTN